MIEAWDYRNRSGVLNALLRGAERHTLPGASAVCITGGGRKTDRPIQVASCSGSVRPRHVPWMDATDTSAVTACAQFTGRDCRDGASLSRLCRRARHTWTARATSARASKAKSRGFFSTGLSWRRTSGALCCPQKPCITRTALRRTIASRIWSFGLTCTRQATGLKTLWLSPERCCAFTSESSADYPHGAVSRRRETAPFEYIGQQLRAVLGYQEATP